MEVRLWVRANSREDLAFSPKELDFGKIQRGATPTTQMTVTYPASAKVQVTGAKCDSEHIDVKLQELANGTTERSYQVSATIRADIPEGNLHATVELTTNNSAMPRLLVPLQIEVEPAPPPIEEMRTIPGAGRGRLFRFPLLAPRKALRP
jgi:hypothetical protein